MLNRWLLFDDVPAVLCTPYHFDVRLVIISYAVATFAGYVAFDLIARVRAATERHRRRAWLITAGLSMGSGVWAMHFIAMLAVEIQIPLRFDLVLTAGSAGIAALTSTLAFALVARDTTSWIRIGVAGVVFGSGVGLMHYSGMAGLHMPARIFYDPWLFILSVVVAVALSTAALALLSVWPRLEGGRHTLTHLLGAALMGLAIVLMHHTGMFATDFYPAPDRRVSGILFDPTVMAAAVACVSLLIIGLTLVAALFDRRVEQAEKLLRNAIESISEGFVIYDGNDRLVMCNQAYRELYAEGGRLLTPGMSFKEVAQLGIHQGKYAGATGHETEWFTELQRQHRDGVGSVERQLSNGSWVLATERRMSDGGTAGVRVNITALKAAQLALRDSEARLDRAQEIARIGNWEVDAATGQRVWSREMYRIRGITEGEDQFNVEGTAQSTHSDDSVRLMAWVDDLRRGCAPAPIEYRILRPDGQELTVRAEGRPIFDADGTTVKVEGTLQAITDRRRTEQQLIQAQKREVVGQLTGGLAHDFNNILGAVIGNIDLAIDGVPAGSEIVGYCQTALDAALSAAELVKRLLAFSRRQDLRPTSTSLERVIASVLPLARRALGEQIIIETVCLPHLWPAIADPAQLESAILNLVVNARDAMPDGGKLTIQARNLTIKEPLTTTSDVLPASEYVEISVSDTGTGMSPEVLARVFEPFFTTKGLGAGSGLGLSMVVGTMQQLGGAVNIESKLGSGTIVRLYLPRTHETVEIITEPSAQPPAPTGKGHILLVEDNADIRALGSSILRGIGYKVTVADSGDAALERIQTGEQFDLLFTDIVMPGALNGLALARELRARTIEMPVLFTSGFSSPTTLGKDIEEFGATLISKPYRKAELAMAVKTVLNTVGAS
jgi:PAS domain S-box-containing protein